MRRKLRVCFKFWKRELGTQQESGLYLLRVDFGPSQTSSLCEMRLLTDSVSEQMAPCNLVLQVVGIHFAHLSYEEILCFPASLK